MTQIISGAVRGADPPAERKKNLRMEEGRGVVRVKVKVDLLFLGILVVGRGWADRVKRRDAFEG